MERLRFVAFNRKQTVITACDGFAKRWIGLCQYVFKVLAVDRFVLLQQLSCGGVAVDDFLLRIDQHQCKRRGLYHGVEQKLALVEALAFLT